MEVKELIEALRTRSSGDGIALMGEKLVSHGDTVKGNGAASLPTGVIMEFDAVITTTRKDRDGDVMEAKGANVDPRAPLLWQHDPDKPVGRMVDVTDRNNERIAAKFHLADTELGRDAKSLIEIGALRISHGFKPVEFEPLGKAQGFHIKAWDLYEVSLVSVPSNVDAVITAHRAGKFHSAQIKSWAESLGEPSQQQTEPSERKDTTMTTTANNPNPATILGGQPRVKAPSERYKSTKVAGKHARTGLAVCNEKNVEVMLPSELEYAKAGVFFKKLAQKSGLFGVTIDEHERDLFAEMVEKDAWCGMFGGQYEPSLTGERVKMLLNDAISGGVEINPVWFDDAVITFPLLHSELYPFVDNRPVPRGASIEGASVGNPTVTWGTPEGTDIGIFDTADLVNPIDSTIHPVSVALEVGRDLMADAPVDIGQTLLQNIGQRTLSALDNVIAVGNGVTQPEGVFTASGISSVNSDNDNAGPPTLTDYEALLFAVAKQYRNQAMRCAFLSNDVTYRRSRGITVDPTNPTTDQRRVLGMDYQSYTTLEFPHRIQNDIPNTQIAFGALSKYRLYRRAGFENRFVDGGKELARRNTVLLVVRGRFGGKVVDASAFAKMVDAQS